MVEKSLEVIVLPSHVDLIPDVDVTNPSDEHDIFYNRHCTDLIRARLLEIKREGRRPLLKTQYPGDVVTSEFDSRDVVTLDPYDDIEILDVGEY